MLWSPSSVGDMESIMKMLEIIATHLDSAETLTMQGQKGQYGYSSAQGAHLWHFNTK
jgi:hypothetical protein